MPRLAVRTDNCMDPYMPGPATRLQRCRGQLRDEPPHDVVMLALTRLYIHSRHGSTWLARHMQEIYIHMPGYDMYITPVRCSTAPWQSLQGWAGPGRVAAPGVRVLVSGFFPTRSNLSRGTTTDRHGFEHPACSTHVQTPLPCPINTRLLTPGICRVSLKCGEPSVTLKHLNGPFTPRPSFLMACVTPSSRQYTTEC